MGVQYNSRIVTDSLALALDAANPKNYNLTAVEVLVVAGGGGGGTGGGGGGAGGLIYNSNFAVTPGSALTVTVGGGGSGASGWGSAGGFGGNSVFGSLTAIGGGAGLHRAGATNSGTGGSGGGDAGGSGYTLSNATAGQGFSGGNSPENGTTDEEPGGGGGGAGGPGENASTPTASDNATVRATAAGAGGPGLGFDISGTFTYYAGGGGGSNRNGVGKPGGIGGGGTGGSSPTAGTPNTGGGGGGTGYSGYGGGTDTGGAGGSGIVIVRYPGPQRAIGGTVTFSGGYTIHTFTTVGSTTFTPLSATNNSAILGLADFSGNNNFGTTANSPVYSSSFGGSVAFGSNNIITVPMSGLRPTSSITQEVWVYITNNTTQVFIGAQYGTSSDNSYALWLNDTNQLAGGIRNSSGFNVQYYNTTITTNTWYHFVHTYDGSNQRLYLNGSQVHSWATSGSITYDANNTLLAVGNDWNGSGYNTGASLGTQGRLSTVKIYNRALTAAEIQQNYNALKGRYEKGTINNPFSSPMEARAYSSGEYYFQSGSMSSPQLLEFQNNYYESRAWVCVFRSPYRSTATTNKIDLNIPMAGLLVQRDTLDLRAAVYWSSPITYNTVGGAGNNTADSGYSPRRVILGNSGGHGIYATNQFQCNWGSATGAIGAGWDGSTCGSFPNDLVWGTGRSDTATYDNRSGTWSHWITWG
jgi:hypothetical protein